MYVNKYDENGKFLDMVEENLFGECEKVLDYLKEKRVCSVIYNDKNSTFMLAEECDEYYVAHLSSEQCRDLSKLFAKIAERIESETQ